MFPWPANAASSIWMHMSLKLMYAANWMKPPGIQDLVMAHEYALFLTRSKLDLVIPGVDCRFSIPGQYDRPSATHQRTPLVHG